MEPQETPSSWGRIGRSLFWATAPCSGNGTTVLPGDAAGSLARVPTRSSIDPATGDRPRRETYRRRGASPFHHGGLRDGRLGFSRASRRGNYPEARDRTVDASIRPSSRSSWPTTRRLARRTSASRRSTSRQPRWREHRISAAARARIDAVKIYVGWFLSTALLFWVMIAGWSWMARNCHPPAEIETNGCKR